FSVTTSNLKLVAEPGNTWSIWVGAAALAAYLFVTVKWARGRPDRFYPTFVAGFALFFSLNVLGNQFFKFRIAGEPSRLMPDVDLALILLVVEGLRRLWIYRGARRAIAAAVGLASFATAVPYVSHAWRIITPDANYKARIEYKLAEWMSAHMPEARTMVT